MSLHLEELVSEIVADSKRLDPFPAALSCRQSSPLIDKALGLMGYNAATIYPEANILQIETLTSILSTPSFHGEPLSCSCMQISSALSQVCGFPHWDENSCSCGQHIQTQERVLFGTPISKHCLERIVESCNIFITEGRGSIVFPLIEALLKISTEFCRFRKRLPASCNLYRLDTDSDELLTSVTDLLERLCNGKLYSLLDPVARAHAWRLDPKLLKQDIAAIVRCAVEQPGLILKNEMEVRSEWKKIVSSLAIFPQAFLEACRLLENWINSTGLSCISEVHSQLTAAVIDSVSSSHLKEILSRKTRL